MRWTKEKPTTPGWYWYQGGMDEVEPSIAYVAMINGRLKAMFIDCTTHAVGCLSGQWSSEPVTPPTNE